VKVSVIISLCNNRLEHFKRSLQTYTKQYIDKKDFEILLIDDAKRNEYIDLAQKAHNEMGLNIRYIRIDPARGKYQPRSFTPALTNNVGFRKARGGVVAITGPETLQAENNISVASEMINRRECVYGLVFRADKKFNKWIDNNPLYLKLRFDHLLSGPGAKAECRTTPPHPPAYWYFMCVAKEYVEKIHGCDEKFLEGICGDDDDFSNRMKFAGVTPVFDHRIIGIHQDHSEGDQKDNSHSVRWKEDWERLRQINLNHMRENIKSKDFIANKNYEWGNQNVVLFEKEFVT
jgi:hypothetical protein